MCGNGTAYGAAAEAETGERRKLKGALGWGKREVCMAAVAVREEGRRYTIVDYSMYELNYVNVIL